MPRTLAQHCAVKWPGDELPKAVATILSESQGKAGAFHNNLDWDGITVISKDCGIFQINIPARDVGTAVEYRLRTESHDWDDITPVLEYSIQRAKALYDQPWTQRRQVTTRHWQPWYGYTGGWATHPLCWVWSPKQSQWNKTGMYIHRAIKGCANYKLLVSEELSVNEAIMYANRQAERFGLKMEFHHDERRNMIDWRAIPPKPTKPPVDGIGPRPKPNNGL